mmetsp:Transcript_36314/g.53294  ORF Transcript_36314/g.53294 Transcript_36314/m.53294 type:complete len:260 (+) Transcript_36314:154-933(+)
MERSILLLVLCALPAAHHAATFCLSLSCRDKTLRHAPRPPTLSVLRLRGAGKREDMPRGEHNDLQYDEREHSEHSDAQELKRQRGVVETAHRVESGADTCFKCGQPGHWASQCPLKVADHAHGVEDAAAGKGFDGSIPAKAEGSCYRCKKTGHWSGECPEKQSNTEKPSNTCFKCGQPGHWASKCPHKLYSAEMQPDHREQTEQQEPRTSDHPAVHHHSLSEGSCQGCQHLEGKLEDMSKRLEGLCKIVHMLQSQASTP